MRPPLDGGPQDRLDGVLAEQDPGGWFRSWVVGWRGRSRPLPDLNGFTTALVLRALSGLQTAGLDPTARCRLDRARARALDCLERCRSTRVEGAFGFWPEGGLPAWFPGALPPDLDDTAVILLELARHGRVETSVLRRRAVHVSQRARLRRPTGPLPPWIVPGAFTTWLGERPATPVVDATVNANVVALLAAGGLTSLPGYREACATLAAGVRWAGGCDLRRRSLSPYYDGPGELHEAVSHAVGVGADELRPVLGAMAGGGWGGREPALDEPLYRMAYGGPRWTAPAVRLARRLARSTAQAA